MTPEREAEIRAEHNEPRDGRCDACDLLAVLDAERKAHEETRRALDWQAERHMEALTDIAALLNERNAERARAEAAESALADVRPASSPTNRSGRLSP